jgi:predicted aminopeptidase
MTHATIYFKGETDFNEQIATFIGNRGAIDFLIEKYGAESKEVAEAIHSQEDDLLFSEWIDQACRQLSDYYAKEISRDEKLRGRETLFRSIEQAFQAMKGRFKTESYQKLEQTELNNAVLLAYRRYFHRLDKFEALYESMGRDLKRIVEFFKKIEVSGDKARLTSFAE